MRTRGGILGGIAIILMIGVGVNRYGPDKVGAIYHTQGEAIKCERVDTFEEAEAYAFLIAQVGAERGFGGGSYHYVVIYDWVFKMNEDNAVSYHSSGMNTATMGVMFCRTDNEDFNKTTMYTGRRLMIELDKQYSFTYALNHADVNKQKTDPHEYIPWIDKMGLRWDKRDEDVRLRSAPPAPSYDKWVRI